ncbi:MAG: SGNH/GDSL hydrolase family protein [Verrucomicrobiaceae bacterium]|nr:SGNH/GDSL hydrolase family protein [Verrucomicrobiaceae bacterium]
MSFFSRAAAIATIVIATSLHAQPSKTYPKVLFLGNSITKHGPKADIDWHGNWGMAASAEDKDYAHVMMKALEATTGAKSEVMIKNIADFERAYAGYDVAGKQKEPITFAADLIVLAIGENVPALKPGDDATKLQASVVQLLNAMKGDRKPTILVRSCFWANEAKDAALKKACDEVGGIYVDIGTIGKDKSLYGRAEREFKNAGVANHPGDKGMAAIAEALMKALIANH